MGWRVDEAGSRSEILLCELSGSTGRGGQDRNGGGMEWLVEVRDESQHSGAAEFYRESRLQVRFANLGMQVATTALSLPLSSTMPAR